MPDKARVAALISGNGTTMSALLYASRLPDSAYEIVLVASNQPDAPGLNIAAAEGIATFAHSHKRMDRAAHETIIDEALRQAGAEYLALCGYMRILTESFVDMWAGRMLNTHPSLLFHSRLPDCPYEIVLVASNQPDARGLNIAAAEGIATFAHSHRGMEREAHEAVMDAALRKAGAEYLALCGYMRILTEGFVDKWAGRMINTHPSLLPKYPGLHTHERAIEAGDSHGGCSVHVVTAELDAGPLLGQVPVAILPGDDAESLARRVLMAEYQLYPRLLAYSVGRERSPDFLVAQVRDRALDLPEAEETLSHGMPCFGIVKGKKFAYVSLDHHGDGKTSLRDKISGPDEQAQLIDMDPDRYYRPAYFGDGWVGIRLDLGDNDWDSIAEWLRRSWQSIAPKKLTGLMDVADEF